MPMMMPFPYPMRSGGTRRKSSGASTKMKRTLASVKKRLAKTTKLAKFKRYPVKTFGRSYFKRGVPGSRSMAEYGASWAEANETQRAARQADHYSGRGAYFGKKIGAIAGRALGTYYGFAPEVGALVGGSAGNWLENKAIDYVTPHLPSELRPIASLYRGTGAYHGGGMATNSLINPPSNPVPMFASAPGEDGALAITHKEYVQDITGSSLFVNNGYPINPGDPALFPWLSQIAANYDEYEFHGLIFHYRTVTTDLSTTSSQLGTVMMAVNYNGAAPLFKTKQELLQYVGSKDVKISQDLAFGVECDPKQNGLGPILYVAVNGSVPVGEDPKTYFLGQFQIATNQTVTTGQIGELWVTYKVVLRKPKLSVALGNSIPYSNLRIAVTELATGVSGGGTALVKASVNNLEDNNYGSPAQVAVSGSASGYFVNTTTPGSIRILSGTQKDNLRASPQVYPSNTAAQQLVGWSACINAATIDAQYIFPEWLQNGTYQVTMTVFNNDGSQVALTASAGGAFGLLSTAETYKDLISLAPSDTNLEIGGNQVTGVVQLKQSFQSQTPTSAIPKPQLVGVKFSVTGTFTASATGTQFINFQVTQVNPASSAVQVF